jgi:hypothetical protein
MSEHTLDLPAAAGRRAGFALGDVILGAFALSVAGTALGAYNLGPVPVQWMAQLLVIGVAVLLGLRHLYAVPGSGLFAVLVTWALVVTIANAAIGDFGMRMPPAATTSYPLFIVLRFMALFAFIAVVFITYWLLREGHRDRVVRILVIGGSMVAAAAIYIYVAQLYGWWEPLRSRLGTSGGEQPTVFTYAFHRALGTFREPSHLAEWLAVPLFLSFAHPGRTRYLHVMLIGTALLLTGSLTGILGVVAGLTGAIVLTNPFRAGGAKLLLQVAGALALALAVFSRVAVSYVGEGAQLLEVIEERLAPVLMGGGMGASNRDYVFEYMASRPIPLVGEGLGNANIVFSEALGSPVVASFVSLYNNYLMSLGVVGVLLLAVFLLRPVVGALRIPPARRDVRLRLVLAGYLTWLLMFAVHSEEPAFMFGVVFALLAFEAREGTHYPERAS